MAKNQSSKFGADDGLFPQPENKPVAHDVQQVQHAQEVQKEIGTTQGKKGQKLKRINMAFSDINHEYITKESRRQGISSTAFVNMIIDEHRSKH